jgi:magnesium transporter
MNLHIPEAKFEYAYPMVIVLLVISAVIPIVFFKRKKLL